MKQLKPTDKRHLDKVTVGFRVEAELFERFTKLADEAGATISDALRQLVQEYVDKFDT